MILANYNFTNSKKFKNIYYFGQFIKDDTSLLLYKSHECYKDNILKKDLLRNIKKKGIEYISNLQGYFCGIYYNYEEKSISFFVDKFGYYEIFYVINDDQIILSDNFNTICKIEAFKIQQVDLQALYEFILFEYPLFGKTFIKKLKILPLGAIYIFNLNDHNLDKIKYFDYKFKINNHLIQKEAISQLDHLFNKSTLKVKYHYPSNTVFGLGLSGGMDSRLVAYYAKKFKLNLKTFIFGEKKSDAYFIAKKISSLLNIDHYEIGLERNFFNLIEKSIEFNPMMNVLYSWYVSVYQRLPKFDVLLTGYNGDNQFGSHLNVNDLYLNEKKEFVNVILKKYCELEDIKRIIKLFNNKKLILRILNDIGKFFVNSPNKEFWQKKEEFNYKYRQRIFIKNNPSFNFFGKYQSISLFNDPDLIDYLLTIPFKMRLKRKLFYKFLKKKSPGLYKIRSEREIPHYIENFFLKIFFKIIKYIDLKLKTHLFYKKIHKNFSEWFSNYKPFENYIKEKFLKRSRNFMEIFNKEEFLKLISKKKWNNTEIYLIFRLLTVKLFLMKLD